MPVLTFLQLPVYLALCQDSIWGVRKAAIENVAIVSVALPRNLRGPELGPVVDQCTKDVSKVTFEKRVDLDERWTGLEMGAECSATKTRRVHSLSIAVSSTSWCHWNDFLACLCCPTLSSSVLQPPIVLLLMLVRIASMSSVRFIVCLLAFIIRVCQPSPL